jgi:transcriptional regulator with XRE-family HTH domain
MTSRQCRHRRGIKAELMAERLGVTRTTLDRLEKERATVGLGLLAAVLFMLDPKKLRVLQAIMSDDSLGQSINDRELPRRIRGSGK